MNHRPLAAVQPGPAAHSRAERWWWLALLVLTALVYARALGYWFLAWDDGAYVYLNPLLVSLDGRHWQALWRVPVVGNYVPVTMLSYAVDFQCWGMNAAGWHATNLLWHLLNVWLCYRLLRLAGLPPFGAWCGSALFALHPVQVESVVWLAERRNLLSTTWLLAALIAHGRSVTGAQRTASRAGVAHSRRWWWLGTLCGLLAVLSKASAVIWPVLLLAQDRWVARLDWRAALRRSASAWLIALGGVWLALWARRVDGFVLPWRGGGVWGTLWTLPRVGVAYLRLVIWPAGLSAWYAVEDSRHWTDLRVWGAVGMIAVIGVILWRWQRRQPRIAWWTALAAVALLPASNVVPLMSWMHDRYLYLPLVGCAGLAGEGVAWLSRRASRRGRAFGLCAAACAIVIALSARTWHRVAVWRDDVTLWSDTVARQPASLTPRVLLGDALIAAGRPAEGQRLQWSVADVEPSAWLGWSARGLLLQRSGRLDEARAYYTRALTLAPGYDQVRMALGHLAYERQDWPAAMEIYTEVLTRHASTIAMERLAAMAQRLHQPAQAVSWYRRALRQQPWRPDVHRRLAALLRDTGSGDAGEIAGHLALAAAWQRDYQRLAQAHRQAGRQYRRWGRADLAARSAQAAAAIEAMYP